MKSNTTKRGREVDDGRILRLWYLQNIWEKATDWGKVELAKWKKIEQSPYVFLSRAPLTFGHSQLVIRSPNGTKQNEEDFFCLASKIIERTIIAFKDAFKVQKLHECGNFNALAVITRTRGKYIKTLVLRASASEDICEEYKIHLVPYFKSHEDECGKRFRTLHGITSEKKGGLLGWLGERENEVDKLLELGPLKEKLDKFANEDLKMAELAKKLRACIGKGV
jgi:hypothetical protein